MAVTLTECGACGQLKFVENVDAYVRRQETGEAVFCEACMALPEEAVEAMILEQERLGPVPIRWNEEAGWPEPACNEIVVSIGPINVMSRQEQIERAYGSRIILGDDGRTVVYERPARADRP